MKHTASIVATLLFSMYLLNTAQANSQSRKNTAAGFYQLDGFALRLQLNPAICFVRPYGGSLKQCQDGSLLSVVGLKPLVYTHTESMRTQSQYVIAKSKLTNLGKRNCASRNYSLSPLQSKVISKWMPDSSIQNLSWQRYGACTNMQVKQYFRLIGTFADSLQMPRYITDGKTKFITKQSLINHIVNKNPSIQPKHINLLCQSLNKSNANVLTELQVCYDSRGKFGNCIEPSVMSCPKQIKILGYSQ